MFLHDCSTAMMFYLVLFSVPKTIHIVMFFVFFLPLRYPAAFIMKRLSSSHRKCFQLCHVYFSSLLALNQRPVIALFMYFFLLRYHRITVGAPGCEA